MCARALLLFIFSSLMCSLLAVLVNTGNVRVHPGTRKLTTSLPRLEAETEPNPSPQQCHFGVPLPPAPESRLKSIFILHAGGVIINDRHIRLASLDRLSRTRTRTESNRTEPGAVHIAFSKVTRTNTRRSRCYHFIHLQRCLLLLFQSIIFLQMRESCLRTTRVIRKSEDL